MYYLNKLEKEYKGEIVDIYINKNNRSIPTIILEDNSEMEILSQWKNHFQIGDYVLKEKGSIIIKLVKNNSKDTLEFNHRDIEIK